MKKKYEAPVLLFDAFEMTTSIAACSYPVQIDAIPPVGSCKIKSVFTSASVCTDPVNPFSGGGNGETTQSCYDIPDNLTGLFNS